MLPCLSLVLIYPDKKGQKKALGAQEEARDRVWYMFVVQNAKSHRRTGDKKSPGRHKP